MKFDMSRAWNEATEMLAANREVVWTVAGVFFFLPGFVQALLTPQIQPPVGASEEAMLEYVTQLYADLAPVLLVTTLVQLLGSLTLLALLRDDSKPTVGEALKAGAIGLLPYIGMYLILVVALALVVTLVLLIPVVAVQVVLALMGIPLLVYAGVKLSLVTPVIAIEKVMNPIAVIQRSWRLTKGNSLRLFLFYFLLGVVYVVISAVAGGLIGLVLALFGEGTAFDIGNGILSGLLAMAGTLVFTVVIAAIHRQLAGPSTGRIDQTFG